MPRPRTITDERLLNALGAVITTRGPGFTVADVAAEAGVSVGTVSQRFGSKHGLLVALSRSAVGQVRDQVRSAENVLEAILGVFRALDDPSTAANNLGQLAIDLADPELRELHGEFFAAFEAELAPLARAVLGAPPHAARILVSLANGAAIAWSVRPTGSLLDRLTEDITAVLEGWQGND
ncbi:TetR/AcrR family transcriptional regulator [Kibdelosporangium aridum]|uniref:TetR/AcrR family transcriptional regulator n=1 Tax=Kibdelosporangium aridum TaxID=2030 RepID=A0A428Z940_KIBAR|nr:TetR/AcrR family transcriptional regulator [Kibdelosporangium aridum]RSM84569.1 TetR/AcrR family transcriptional regulator [Kibdelosporangium aridum]